MVRRPPLRYFGSKWRIAPWIISHFPEHRVYVEPFAGGASVLIRKPKSKVEIYNDIDSEIVNVFRILRSPKQSEKLKKNLILTPFSRDEYLSAFKKSKDPIEAARRTIIKAFMGHGSDSVNMGHISGFRSKTSNENTHRCASMDWINYPPEIKKFCERLLGVTIENKPALDLIPDFDGKDTLFYVDPPYIHSTREGKDNYRHEMKDDDHGRLLEKLRALTGMVVLSGYRTPLYDSLGWKRVEFLALADGAKKRRECLWLNPAAQDLQRQSELPI